MIQTAEGALGEVHAIMQRMRELGVQAANDSLTSEDRQYIQLEVEQLKEEIDRISTTTQFNRKKLLDGSSSALWSSDKLSTEAIIRGSLTSRDRFGQKVVAEGNFKIEITAEPGESQVQKSHVMNVSEDHPAPPASPGTAAAAPLPEPTVVIDIETVSASDPGGTYTFVGGLLTLTDPTQVYKITGTGASTTNRIAVQSGISASVILSGVNIDASSINDAVAA